MGSASSFVANNTDPSTRIYVDELLMCLDPMENLVVRLALGNGMSLRQVSRILGYSHDWVWRVKCSAIRKLADKWPGAFSGLQG